MALLKILTFYAGTSDDPCEVRDVRLSYYKGFKVNRETEELILFELPEVTVEQQQAAFNREYKTKESKENGSHLITSCGAGILNNLRDASNRDREDKSVPKEITKPTRFDLIVKNAKSKEYGVSVRRFHSERTARELFEMLSTRIPSLLRAAESFPSKDVLRSFVSTMIENPSWTIAHFAVFQNLLDVLKHPTTAKVVNIGCKKSGRTPLHMALEAQNVPATQILIDQGARVDVLDNQRNSPFHIAIKTESKSLVEIISRAPGAAVGMNQRNADGQTPLQAACINGLTGCVEQLLRQGADINSASFGTEKLQQGAKQVGEREIGLFSERLMRKGGTPLHWVKSRASLEMMIDIGCDLNARNSSGDTALHVVASKRRLDSLIWLLIEGADVNVKGSGGDTPLHVAVRAAKPPKPQDAWMLFKQKVEQKKSYAWPTLAEPKHDGLPIVQILLAFGADVDAVNDQGVSPRHLAAVIASDSRTPRLDQLLFTLHAVGAKRCKIKLPDCTDGCSPDGTFDGVPPVDFCKEKIKVFDGPLSETVVAKALERKRQRRSACLSMANLPNGASSEIKSAPLRRRRCRALAIDGGGVKGLVTLRTLKCLEEALGNKPLFQSFDWVMGTSAGGITTLCMAAGHSVTEVFCSAYRLKEKFIVGPRPYDTDGVETFLKKLLGDETKMSDIPRPRVSVTAVNAQSWPTQLKLFRNYTSPRSMLDGAPEPADSENLWSAARATGAAPTFFKPYKNYLDGAIISNNPTLDLLTEITEYNAAMEGKPSEQVEVDIVVSVGGGMRPSSPVSTIDALQLDPGLFGAAKVAYSVGHLMKFAVEQISEPDGRHVDRARAWCYSLSIPYARLQPALSQYIAVNESDNRVLAKILWETMAFFRQHPDELATIGELLRDD